MRLRTPLNAWSATFFTTLGLTPLVACGGATNGGEGNGNQNQNGSDAGTGGAAGSENTGSGSVTAAGGEMNSGGGPVGGYGGAAVVGAGGAGAYGGYGTGGMTYGTGGTTGGTAGAGAAPSLPDCRNPTPHLGADGEPTGFVDCEGGSMHRPAQHACASILPRADFVCPYPMADGGLYGGDCNTDADCTAQPNGHCGMGIQMPACYCEYGCITDVDCGAGQICVCDGPVGQCMAADCGTDADCNGGLCLSYDVNPFCGGTAFACQRLGDTCASTTDCGGGGCTLEGGFHRCSTSQCAIGRPFLVGGEARLAVLASRSDWSSRLAPCVDGLSGAARVVLAKRWTEIGLMEHASIAAFARFALEILSLGAPPELVVATHAAMADETVHARDAFALASSYAGAPRGPGRLDVDRALASRSPLDVVRTAILEGCIGETVAAVEAAEALAHATDPAVRESLARVTLDETRHAELAWRFVQWVLETSDAELRAATARELVALVEAERIASTIDVGAAALPAPLTAELATHGVIGPDGRSEIRRRVLAEVVAPCARALAASAVQVDPVRASIEA